MTRHSTAHSNLLLSHPAGLTNPLLLLLLLTLVLILTLILTGTELFPKVFTIHMHGCAKPILKAVAHTVHQVGLSASPSSPPAKGD